MLKFIVISFALLFFSVSNAEEFYGSVSVDVKIDEEDVISNLDYLSIGNSSKNFHLYGLYRASLDSLYIEEAYVKFTKYGLNFNIGRRVQQFGIVYLGRPENSVFISFPKFDRYGEMVGVSFFSEILNIDLGYEGNSDVTIKAQTTLFDGTIIPSISYTNADNLEEQYENWAISNEVYFKSLYVNFSSLSEWWSDTGDFWTRLVITPGAVNIVGVFGSYYNTPNMNETLEVWNITSPDIWTYGFFVDVSDNMVLSSEWLSGKSLIPTTLRFSTTF